MTYAVVVNFNCNKSTATEIIDRCVTFVATVNCNCHIAIVNQIMTAVKHIYSTDEVFACSLKKRGIDTK